MKPIAIAVLSLVVAVFLVAAAGQSATTLAVDEPTIERDELGCAMSPRSRKSSARRWWRSTTAPMGRVEASPLDGR